VRASAAAVVCIAPGSKALGAVEGLLKDAEACVRAEAAAGLIRCGGAEGLRQAWPVLMEMVSSEDVETRVCAAHAVGLVGSKGLTGVDRIDRINPEQPVNPGSLFKADLRGLLLRLLRDDVAAVRVAALRAAERVSCPEAIPVIVEMLAEDRTHEAAAQALVAHGDEGIETLRQAVTPDASGRVGRAAEHVPAVLARIGSRSAFEVLRGLRDAKVDGLRHAAIDATCRLLRERPTIRADVGDLQSLLLAEIGRAMVWQSLREEVRWLDGTDLLLEAIDEMRKECLHRIFALLDILHPQADMEAVRRGLMEGAGEVRANAVEVLDNVLKGEIHDRLFALIEPSETPRGTVENAVARLRALTAWNDDWLRVCALHAVGRGHMVEARPEVESALNSPGALVRETAVWAMGQIAKSK
jgi:HEAT repeat protein